MSKRYFSYTTINGRRIILKGKRYYPYQGQRRPRGTWDPPKAVHLDYPVPCVIGAHKGAKTYWLAIGGNLGTVKTREEAAVCKTQKVVEILVNYAGSFQGFTKVFVERL